jgi:pimeloyl-ACP methyl ester carboxylesterase
MRGPRASTVDNLHRLLAAGGEHAPFVLVGASRGGLFVRDYQAEHPEQVVGLVLVDPSTEDRLYTRIGGHDVLIADVSAEQLRSTLPTHPVAVSRRSPQTGSPFNRLPPELYRTRVLLEERLIASIPDTVSPAIIATASENERALLARLRERRRASAHPLGDMPVIVLSRGTDPNPDREVAHRAVAAMSTSSRHAVVAGAGHEIHLYEPAAVVRAIAELVEGARRKSAARPAPR